jgi:site-specific recombinase XerD
MRSGYARYNCRLADRYERWMTIQHYTRESRSVYRKTIRLFLKFLGDKSIARVTHLDVRNFIATLSENGASINCARRHVTVLRRFYDFLHLGGVVSYVAPRLVTIRQLPRKPVPHLSEDEMGRLIAAAQTARDKALIEFFYGTGCRMKEVRYLRVQDLDLQARTARVTGKYAKTRVVLITQSAVNALRKYIGDRKAGYVFQQDYPMQKGYLSNWKGVWMARWRDHRIPERPSLSRYLGSCRMISFERAKATFDQIMAEAGSGLKRPERDAPLTTNCIDKVLRRLASQAGVKRVTAHIIRHSFATHLYENNADLIAIQTLLGHSDIATTAKYYARISAFRLVDTFERCHPLGVRHCVKKPAGILTTAESAEVRESGTA